jgi:hypothetical protein
MSTNPKNMSAKKAVTINISANRITTYRRGIYIYIYIWGYRGWGSITVSGGCGGFLSVALVCLSKKHVQTNFSLASYN